ncbi:DUF456 domain-containing protein [Streptomyces sp. NPDC008313]|uniref:DUF456 domain-containing protein n=1 Tax=Streptomyces sp. NPDC008313 TaxID=3364826 RepID=UPI0036E64B08
MGVSELLLVGLVMLLGLCGVLVPGVPGSWLVWAGVLWWALTDPDPLSLALLAATALVLLLAGAVCRRLPAWNPLEHGVPSHLTAYAGWGALLGFFVLPVIGAVPGFLGGLYLAARLRPAGHPEAMDVVRAMMRTGGARVLTELFACLLVLGAWLGATIWG